MSKTKEEGKPTASLHIEKFRRTIGDFTVSAHFTVAPGERVAILAPSGTGKTTLLRWMAGFDPEERAEGEICWGDERLTARPPEARNFGLVFQDFALFSHWSALRNVAFGLEMRGASRAAREKLGREWLEKLKLQHRAETLAGFLSGGEKQRVALARALCWKPRALLFDEPFSALDLATRRKARHVVHEILRASSIPMVFVTHDPEDVTELATRTLEYSGSRDGLTHHFGFPV